MGQRRPVRPLDDGVPTPPGKPRHALRLAAGGPGGEQAVQRQLALAAHQDGDAGVAGEELRALEGDLGTTEDDAQRRGGDDQGIDQFQGLAAVPEVDREGDHLRLLGEQGREDALFRLVDGELADRQFDGEVAAVGGQAGEGQAGVNELAVQGGQNDAHGAQHTQGAAPCQGGKQAAGRGEVPASSGKTSHGMSHGMLTR